MHFPWFFWNISKPIMVVWFIAASWSTEDEVSFKKIKKKSLCYCAQPFLSVTVKLKKWEEKFQLNRYDCHLDIRHFYFQYFSLEFQISRHVNNWKISTFNNFKEWSKYKTDSFPTQISKCSGCKLHTV